MPCPGELCTWPRNPLERDSKRRPVVVLSPTCTGRSTVIEVPFINALASDSLALCDQITCLLVSLLRHRAALTLGLMPSDLRLARGRNHGHGLSS
jgi:mRNA-degrading endonuclease toxin of MazEF toxin-antitoxin module